jgi:hypothetical protein
MSKMTENVEKILELVHEDHHQKRAPRHQWDQLWSLPGDLNRKIEYVLHYHEVCSPTVGTGSEAAALVNVCLKLQEDNEDPPFIHISRCFPD